jgi:hypothetical protein
MASNFFAVAQDIVPNATTVYPILPANSAGVIKTLTIFVSAVVNLLTIHLTDASGVNILPGTVDNGTAIPINVFTIALYGVEIPFGNGLAVKVISPSTSDFGKLNVCLHWMS